MKCILVIVFPSNLRLPELLKYSLNSLRIQVKISGWVHPKNIEDEACESSVIVVTNIRVHQQTVVVHVVLTALGELGGRKGRGGGRGGGRQREKERKRERVVS